MPADEKTIPDIPEALAAERAYLAAARAELGRMRARTLALDADKAGGSALSSEYLKGALYYRAQALIDDPETPLFFGRLDMSGQPERDETTYYVGRRHVHDDAGDPVVIDWRADVSRAFYRATRTEPMDVLLRRRFGFERGTITAYEDEHLLAPREGDAQRSRILASEIERPRVGPMRDIVATIQPEQDVIVRADVNQTVCVQGAPGTGKTAVGLHRAAYLLYAFRDRLRRGGVLIVGPNSTFLSYIAAVLPALGEVDVKQVTVDDLVTGVRVRAVERSEVATLKGDARMATVLHNAVYARLAEPAEALVLNRGSRRWRVSTYELTELVEELTRRDVRYGSGRAMLAQRLALPAHQDGGRGRVARRPGAGRGRSQCAGQGDGRPAVAGGGPGASRAHPALRRRRARRSRRRCPDRGRTGAAALADSASRSRHRPLVECRRRAGRRGARRHRTHTQPRPRRARRGPGPEPDAAAGGRAALLDRSCHRAR